MTTFKFPEQEQDYLVKIALVMMLVELNVDLKYEIDFEYRSYFHESVCVGAHVEVT